MAIDENGHFINIEAIRINVVSQPSSSMHINLEAPTSFVMGEVV